MTHRPLGWSARRPVARASTVAAAAFLATACSPWPAPLRAPQVHLVRAHLASAAPAGSPRLDVELAVKNPGSEPLVLRAVDWEIALGQTPLLRGRRDLADLGLAPGGARVIPLSVALSPALADQLRAAPPGRARLRGMAHLERPDGEGAPAPFDLAAASR